MDIRDGRGHSMVLSITYGTEELTRTTSSLRNTTAEIQLLAIRCRVHFATCKGDHQLLWFQQEHSVRTAGPSSTRDIWSPKRTLTEDETPTFAWMKHQKFQLADIQNANQWSTRLKSSVEHYHVSSTSAEESWPASSALNEKSVDKNLVKVFSQVHIAGLFNFI